MLPVRVWRCPYDNCYAGPASPRDASADAAERDRCGVAVRNQPTPWRMTLLLTRQLAFDTHVSPIPGCAGGRTHIELARTHTHMDRRTDGRTHARTHPRTHTPTHSCSQPSTNRRTHACPVLSPTDASTHPHTPDSLSRCCHCHRDYCHLRSGNPPFRRPAAAAFVVRVLIKDSLSPRSICAKPQTFSCLPDFYKKASEREKTQRETKTETERDCG